MSPTLPFDQEIEIRPNAGDPTAEPLAVVKGHIWPLDAASETSRGERYDAEGELEPAATEHVVGASNVKLVHEGASYAVVSAVRHDFVPHVSVSLFEHRPAG